MKISHYFFLLAAIYGARFVGEKSAAAMAVVASVTAIVYAVVEAL